MREIKRNFDTVVDVVETLQVLVKFEEVGDPRIVHDVFGRSVNDALKTLSTNSILNSLKANRDLIGDIETVLNYADLPQFDNIMQRRQFLKRTPFDVLLSVARKKEAEVQEKQQAERDEQYTCWLNKLSQLTKSVLFADTDIKSILREKEDSILIEFVLWNGKEELLNQKMMDVFNWLKRLTTAKLFELTGYTTVLTAMRRFTINDLEKLMNKEKAKQAAKADQTAKANQTAKAKQEAKANQTVKVNKPEKKGGVKAAWTCNIYSFGGVLIHTEDIYRDKNLGYFRQYQDEDQRVYYNDLQRCVMAISRPYPGTVVVCNPR